MKSDQSLIFFLSFYICFTYFLYFFFPSFRVGLEVPSVEVRYQNLNIVADVQTGSRALPTLINYTRNALEVQSN